MKTINRFLELILLGGSTIIVCAFLLIILIDLFSKGSGVLTWNFLTNYPHDDMTKGGIFPAIAGSFFLTIITTFASVPFGVGCAIYLNEYAGDNALSRLIRASIRNLSGIPSIIYGLFGLALFVQAFRIGTSVLAAGLTLGLLSLPYIITTTEEALKRVPLSLREGALSLGATKFETIRDVVIPAATPGILTGIILTLSRAAGETAPILFTGAAYYVNGLTLSLTQEFMALPYHLYMLSTQHPSIEQVRPLAYGTALVLILLVFSMNLTAFYIRYKFRRYEG